MDPNAGTAARVCQRLHPRACGRGPAAGPGGRVHTGFTRPNGYLHIGHAKSICLNFGVAVEFGGACNLRFDDTNPETENTEYVDAIQRDVRWLGFDWAEHLFYASDYFEQLYQFAEQLIRHGHAYVDSLTADEILTYRGTLTEPGTNSPYRERSVEDSLDLFRGMRGSDFDDGAHVLRAKIDMASPNINMRDPILYRIRTRRTPHGRRVCIYPTYDYAHPVSDALEGSPTRCARWNSRISPLYDWVVDTLRRCGRTSGRGRADRVRALN